MSPPYFEPDFDKLHNMHFDLGWSYQTIADHYGVSKAGVFKRFQRQGVTNEGVDPFKRLCPWRISDAHREDRSRRMLRWLEKSEAGVTLSGREQVMLDNWQTERAGRVVTYDRHGGFRFVGRTAADGDSIIRTESRLNR